MARPVKKTPEEWRKEILNAAQNLFISKGYEETSISDIMDTVGGAKGMFYRCFQSKEEVMYALGNQMFFEDNPFETVKGRDDLNGLQKIRLLLTLNQSDAERNQINMQAVPILIERPTHFSGGSCRKQACINSLVVGIAGGGEKGRLD